MALTILIAISYLIFNTYFIRFSLNKSNYLAVPIIFTLLLFNYSIRPVLSSIFNYWTDNSYQFQDSSSYNFVYLHSVSAVVLLQSSYLIGIEKLNYKMVISKKTNFCLDIILFALLLSVVFVYLFLKYGGSWLSFNREVSASLVAPEFRYLFPFVIFISLSVFFRRKEDFSPVGSEYKMLVFFLIILFSFTLLSQRGYLVYILLLTIPFLKNKKHLYIIGAAFLFFSVFILRTIGAGEVENNFLQAERLLASNGDSVDTWFIVLDYVEKNGILFGKGIVSNFFNILPLELRTMLSSRSSLDELNIFYFGDNYLDSRFGYNCDTLQELFMNFGYFSYVLLIPLGLLVSKVDKKFSELRQQGDLGTKSALYFILIQTLLAFGSLQWLIFFCIIYFILKWGRIILLRSY